MWIFGVDIAVTHHRHPPAAAVTHRQVIRTIPAFSLYFLLIEPPQRTEHGVVVPDLQQ
jgi:hypothetical protein